MISGVAVAEALQTRAGAMGRWVPRLGEQADGTMRRRAPRHYEEAGAPGDGLSSGPNAEERSARLSHECS